MGDDSDAQLEQRVDHLEQQLSKMLPGRRGFLKGLGAAALGGAAVGGATGGASGQSAAGQIGTSSSPVDVEAANINAGSVNTDKQNNTIHWLRPDDHQTVSEIQTFLNNVPDGHTVFVEQGSWTGLNGTITVTGKTGLRIRGPGFTGAYFKHADNVDDNLFEFQDCAKCEISGLNIDGNGANQGDANDNSTQVGVMCFDCDEMDIHHNYVHHTVYANIRLQHSSIVANGHRIHHNICEKTYAGTAGAEDGVSITCSGDPGNADCWDWAIAYNYIKDCGHQSIETSAECSHGVVAGNIIENGASTPIVVHFGENVTVANNTIRDCGSFSAINLHNAKSVAIGNVIDCPNAQHGININGDGTNSVAIGNVIEGTGASNKSCIYLSGTETGAIGNVVKNCDGSGVRIEATDCYAHNNIIYAPGNFGIRSRSVRTAATGNEIYDSTDKALQVEADNSQVVSNYASGSGKTQFGVNGASYCLVANNYAVNSDGNFAGGFVVFNSGSDNLLVGNYAQNNNYPGYTVGSSMTDTFLFGCWGAGNSQLTDDTGGRTRWDGVIGGGPLGGVDLSSTTGQFDGDRAIADGTSTAAAYASAVWDAGNSHWEHTDPTGTV